MKNLRSHLIHSSVVSFKQLRGLSLFAALALLTACGGGGGSGSSSSGSSWLPYAVYSYSTGSSLHLVNTSTLANKELPSAIDRVKHNIPLHPWQVQSDGRLLTLPASHLVYFDTSLNRYVRKSLDSSGSTFQFPEGCDSYYGGAVYWTTLYCGSTSEPRLVNWMATSGDGVISEVEIPAAGYLTVLIGTWDEAGKPSGFIGALYDDGTGIETLYRYRSNDWSHPEQLLDTNGDPVTAQTEGLRFQMGYLDQPVNVRHAFWLRAYNSATEKTWYRVTWSHDTPSLEKVVGVDMTDVGHGEPHDGALYYVKTAGGVPSLYKLERLNTIPSPSAPNPFKETEIASVAAGSTLSIMGFTPSRVVWLDSKDGDHTILQSDPLSGLVGLTASLWNGIGVASDSRITNFHVSDERVFFSVANTVTGRTGSYRINSDGTNQVTLGDGRLFRADFAGTNSGTSQGGERIYLANVDEVGGGNLVLTAGKLDSTSGDFITLGTLANGAGCDDTELTVKIAHSPAGNQFAWVECAFFSSGGIEEMNTTGIFTFKPDQENSLSAVQDFLASDVDGEIRAYW